MLCMHNLSDAVGDTDIFQDGDVMLVVDAGGGITVRDEINPSRLVETANDLTGSCSSQSGSGGMWPTDADTAG